MTMLPPHQDDQPEDEVFDDRDARIESLAKQAEALSAGVTDLMNGTGTAIVGLAKRGRSTRRLVMMIGLSLVLDVLLTLAVTFTVTRMEGTSNRVDKLSSNLRQQTCGILQILVNADTPQAAAMAKARGDDMKARANSFQLIHHSYAALTCAQLIK